MRMVYFWVRFVEGIPSLNCGRPVTQNSINDLIFIPRFSTALQLAGINLRGGVSPRVSPMIGNFLLTSAY